MYHLLAHYGSLGATEDTTIPAVADPGWNTVNSQFQMPENMGLKIVHSLGALLLRTRLITPFTDFMSNPYMVPAYDSAGVNPVIFNPVTFPGQGFPLKRSELLRLAATNSGAGPTDTYAFAFVQNRFEPAPTGDIYYVRGTSTTAATANVWSSLTMTWTFNLPAGRYAVVGGMHYSATGLVCRLVFPGEFYKPGFFSGTDKTYVPWMPQLRGELGQLGTFDLNTFPTPQVICSAADAAHEVYLAIIRMG